VVLGHSVSDEAHQSRQKWLREVSVRIFSGERDEANFASDFYYRARQREEVKAESKTGSEKSEVRHAEAFPKEV
jgi:hypothetical protein